MKKNILILILSVFFIGNIHPELKHFLPNSNAVISILEHKYRFEGDTIIEDKRYTKVYRLFCTSETECDDLEYYAAVREDTIAEKIYCKFVNRPDEKLLTDFAVEKGDEVTVYCNWIPSRGEKVAFVVSVDSVVIDGQERKRVNLGGRSGYPYPADSWVEGLGSVVYGLFFPHPDHILDVGDHPLFLCFHVDNTLVYQNPNYNVCYVEDRGVGIVQKENSVSFTVFPTLTNDYLSVKKNDANSYFYTIYNMQGVVIQSEKLLENRIDVRSFSSGIYFVRFYTGKNVPVYTGKFVKYN